MARHAPNHWRSKMSKREKILVDGVEWAIARLSELKDGDEFSDLFDTDCNTDRGIGNGLCDQIGNVAGSLKFNLKTFTMAVDMNVMGEND